LKKSESVDIPLKNRSFFAQKLYPQKNKPRFKIRFKKSVEITLKKEKKTSMERKNYHWKQGKIALVNPFIPFFRNPQTPFSQKIFRKPLCSQQHTSFRVELMIEYITDAPTCNINAILYRIRIQY